jgi:hypothetical protein
VKRALALLPFALPLALSCGTETGNPVVDLSFALEQAPVGGDEITGAWVSVERIRLRNAADCNGSAEVEILGPLAIDLLAQQPPPALQDIEVRGGGYCRFEFAFHVSSEALPPEIPAALDGRSLLIEGTRADGTPFVLRSDRSGDLRLDAVDEAGFPISSATKTLFVAFQEEALFAGIDLDLAEVGVDGVIRIESGQNDDLLNLFEANLDAALRLFDDDDGDGALEAGENDDDDLLAEVLP